MDGAMVWVSQSALTQEAVILHLLTHQATRHADLLSAAHHLARRTADRSSWGPFQSVGLQPRLVSRQTTTLYRKDSAIMARGSAPPPPHPSCTPPLHVHLPPCTLPPGADASRQSHPNPTKKEGCEHKEAQQLCNQLRERKRCTRLHIPARKHCLR